MLDRKKSEKWVKVGGGYGKISLGDTGKFIETRVKRYVSRWNVSTELYLKREGRVNFEVFWG